MHTKSWPSELKGASAVAIHLRGRRVSGWSAGDLRCRPRTPANADFCSAARSRLDWRLPKPAGLTKPGEEIAEGQLMLPGRGRASGRAGARILDEALCMPITRRPPLATMVVLSLHNWTFSRGKGGRPRGAGNLSSELLGKSRSRDLWQTNPQRKGCVSTFFSLSCGSSESRNVGSRIFSSKNSGDVPPDSSFLSVESGGRQQSK